MCAKVVGLDEFIAEYRFSGTWEVSYYDGTHLPETRHVKLGEVTIDYDEPTARIYPVLPFSFGSQSGDEIKSRLLELFNEWKEKNTQSQKIDTQAMAKRAAAIVRDQLAESMVRVGLLRPVLRLMSRHCITNGFLEAMSALSSSRYLILVADTSAVRRAAVSFLRKCLPKPPIWAVVPVFVMTEVQLQVQKLNEQWGESRDSGPKPDRYDILRRRPQVTCASRELNYMQRSCPVELLSSLPEHMGQYATVDRSIIESVKSLKRGRGVHQGVYLVTGDKDMASLAALEGVDTLHIGVPSLPESASSVRYDSYNQRLVLAPLHFFLWDLAQVFSVIQVRNQRSGQEHRMIYYSKARDGFLVNDVMEIQEH